MKIAKLSFTGCNVLYSVIQTSLIVANINASNTTETIDVLFSLYEILICLCYIGYFLIIYRNEENMFLYFAIIVENMTHFIIGFIYALQIKLFWCPDESNPCQQLNPYTLTVLSLYILKVLATYCTYGCVYSYLNRPVPEQTLNLFAKKIPPPLDIDSCVICLDEYTLKSTIGQLPCGHYFHMMCLKSCKTLRCPSCQQTMDTAINYHAAAGETV